MHKLLRKKVNRIGVLGGTFDPPHKGHLYISRIAFKKLKLDKLFWIITKKNPLKKKPYLSIKKRIKLSKRAVSKEKKIFVLYLDDKVRSNNSYNLLKYLKKKNKNTKIFFLMGADNLVKFHKWKNWKKIPKLSKLVIFPRGNYSVKKNKYKALKKLKKQDLIYINSKKVNISSSLIRKFW